MQTGKRAICAGPGNPPVLVDGTPLTWTAPPATIIQGAAYDNNLLCIGEKEVFVLDSMADKFMAALEKQRRGPPQPGAGRATDQGRVHLHRGPGRGLRRMPRSTATHRQGRVRAGPGGRR